MKNIPVDFGTLELINDFPWPEAFKLHDAQRRIWVWLPPNYAIEPQLVFPVLYMHDGQNVFRDQDATYGNCWQMIGAQQQIIENGGQGQVVVAIEGQNQARPRFSEYSPWVNESMDLWKGFTGLNAGGRGHLYLKLLVSKVIPFIQQHYRVSTAPENVTLGGSSMGGMISLFAATHYEHVFGRYLAMSTATWFAQTALLECLSNHTFQSTTRIYCDVGTQETSNEELKEFPSIYIDGNQQMINVLQDKLTNTQLRYIIDEGAIHNEVAWAKRLPHALSWLNRTTEA